MAAKPSEDLMRSMVDVIWEQKDEEGNNISEVFHEVIPRKELPDYYRVIKNPIAMKTLLNKIKYKKYLTAGEFLRDGYQIFHNAKTYNRPSSQIYKDAITLENIWYEEAQKHKDAGLIPADEAERPDLGPLPSASPTPSGDSDAEGEDVEEDEEDQDEGEDEEEEEDDDDDEDHPRKGRMQRRRTATKKAAEEAAKAAVGPEGRKASIQDTRKKRGRPPRVDTPMESRIKAVLKGMRKYRDKNGDQKHIAFEKLPDVKQYPEYYAEIKNPMAIDTIKKRVKRREYKSVDMFMEDVETMFENAKHYNEDNSAIYKDACVLQKECRRLAEVEKAKDDSEYAGGASDAYKHTLRFPVESIEHKGQFYAVGDWIHIMNPNDMSKPTVGQIFRTWSDAEDRKWINACWYYRPEQTVHWVEKHFYPEEVVKTGQYRDHHIDEVIDKCFVMFYTRFSRGRPKGFENKAIYVCESRYNEVEKHFNKIKTWKSCIPDEVRSQDYEMVMFERQADVRKKPSPLLHLLPENASENDPLPEATMGAENGPPIIGAVFKRARRPNDSPPPEPTPPPQPAPQLQQQATSHRTPSVSRAADHSRFQEDAYSRQLHHQSKSPAHAFAMPGTPAAMGQKGGYAQMPMANFPSPYPGPFPHAHAGMEMGGFSNSPNISDVFHQPALLQAAGRSSQSFTPRQQQQQQQQQQQAQQQLHHQPVHQPHHTPAAAGQSNAYNPPPPPNAFTLPDLQIPEETAKHFQRDGEGNILWFSTTPHVAPKQTPTMEEVIEGKAKAPLGHSAEYLAMLPILEEKRKKRGLKRELNGTIRMPVSKDVYSREFEDKVIGRVENLPGSIGEALRENAKKFTVQDLNVAWDNFGKLRRA